MRKASNKEKSRVFLLDAHEAARHGLARLIEAEPDLSVCGEAADVDIALRGIPAVHPDAVVVSLEPLDGDGPSPVERLRWSHPELPLIVVSLKESGGHGRRMLQAGAAGYVTKARASHEIVPALRRVLSGGVYRGPQS